MSVRLSILLVVVLALIGGAVWITLALREKEPSDNPPWMFLLNMEDIASVSVTHKDKRVDYALEGGQWVIKDGNDTPVGQRWIGTTLILSGPRASRALADQIDDPAEYGLDTPQTDVQIVDKSGQPLRVHLGDPTPNNLNWYARLVGSGRLFLVASEWGEVITRLATEPPYPSTPTPEPPAEGPTSTGDGTPASPQGENK